MGTIIALALIVSCGALGLFIGRHFKVVAIVAATAVCDILFLPTALGWHLSGWSLLSLMALSNTALQGGFLIGHSLPLARKRMPGASRAVRSQRLVPSD